VQVVCVPAFLPSQGLAAQRFATASETSSLHIFKRAGKFGGLSLAWRDRRLDSVMCSVTEVLDSNCQSKGARGSGW